MTLYVLPANAIVEYLMGASEVSANLYCNSRTSVLGRLRDYLRLFMGRTLLRFATGLKILTCSQQNVSSYLLRNWTILLCLFLIF